MKVKKTLGVVSILTSAVVLAVFGLEGVWVIYILGMLWIAYSMPDNFGTGGGGGGGGGMNGGDGGGDGGGGGGGDGGGG